MTSQTPLPTGADSRSGLSAKGLSAGKIGAIGGAVIGISCIAPAYTLTSGLGPTIAEAGVHTPAILLIGFVPMLLVVFGYRELNTAMPDSGTTFTWATRAFGPWIGWMGGWGLIAATVLVLSNLAAVAVDFLFLLLSQVFSDPAIAELTRVLWINIPVTVLLTAAAAWVSYRGVEATKKVQVWLVAFQVIALVWFVVAAFVHLSQGTAFDATPVELGWFNPAEAGDFSTIAAAVSLSIFLFWGWDTVITMNEETKNPEKTPGRAAMLTIIAIVVIYIACTLAVISFAGVGTEGLGAGNPDNQESIFAALAGPVMGPFAILVSIAVLSSSIASLQSTMVSPSRTILAMGHYRALPEKYGRVSPRYKSPSVATVTSAGAAIVFYVVMRLLSENALWDTITALGLMVCFYYGITGLACIWYFRTSLFASAKNVFFRFLFPLLGGVTLLVIFVTTAIDSMDPAYGSGSSVFGIGLVFVLGIGVLLLGVVLMIVQSIRHPAFFRGQTLKQGVHDGE
ncbi:amino acid/polyamine/organocation transporter (APC superfamily) [Brevibacterium sanguinis]|uniref:Amino acid/polyamine/organocation transporter (APC superfamily) n=2 Tax=Brevibacterium TaxID=1696 RepID=A0A366ILK5_9MICO|nr:MULTISPECIES: APC family permease [Brevibacterium]RBP64719.1 amino acid/polyamine/organocation transporter (APC superfamily) [Brevibacterium sanguinis]RBP71638.1 amino acid/polyamine/organocation transporter (APC superfamily) [Brevibacterium celere]